MADGAARMGGLVRCAQGRAATLSRRSRMTACWRRRCRCGTAAPRPTHVRRRAGRTGGAPGARRAYGAAARRHARGRLRGMSGRECLGDAVASTVRVSGCVWRGREGVGSRRSARPARFYFAEPYFRHQLLQCKNLNRSWPNFEYENCRSSNPLSLSKRLYRVFLNRICKGGLPTLNASLCAWTGDADLGASLSCFSTQNLKCQST
jgi:hypothetical protein